MSMTTGEQLVKIKTDIEYIKLQIVDNNTKIDSFINKADTTYARQVEVRELQDKIVKLSKSDESQWKKILAIGERVALISAILFFAGKDLGLLG